MKTTVTAIVPTYNRASYLGECLNALATQTRPVDEIIVWDDGSTDDTSDIVRQWDAGFGQGSRPDSDVAPDAADEGTLRYFRSENGGKSRALNHALQHARGDYIWICDDDDLALPDAVALLAGCLDADAALVAAAGSYRRFTTDEVSGARTEEGPGHWPDLSSGSVFRHILEDMFIFQNATMVRRSALQRAGPFREDLPRSIDYDMILRLAAIGAIEVLDEPVFLQRQHEGDRGPAVSRHAAESSVEVWKETDRLIFDDFRDAIPISSYEAMLEGPDTELIRRAALLQRACVYARHDDWERALEDMRDAARVLPDVNLTDTEHWICRRAMAGKFFIDTAVPRELRRKLIAFAGTSPAAAGIVRALARGIVWRARHALQCHRPRHAIEIGHFAGSLRLAARAQSGKQPGALAERRDLDFGTGYLTRTPKRASASVARTS